MRALIGPRLWPSSGRVVFGLEPSSRPQIPACSGGREVDLSRLQPIKTKYKHPIPAFFLLHIMPLNTERMPTAQFTSALRL